MSNIKQKIRQSSDLSQELVEVPEWDVSILVRSMSARQRAQFAAQIEDAQREDGVVQRIEALWRVVLLNCCFDPETGEHVFDHDDIEWLMEEKSGIVIDRLANSCLEVSGLREKSVDEAGKSSSDSPTETGESTPSDGSTSI